MLRSVAILVLLGAAACRPAAPPKDPPAPREGALPPPFNFAEAEAGLLFSYVDAAGAVRSADALKDVPETARKNLMVVDLRKSPEERMADRFVYFADATVKNPEGSFTALPVSRYQAPAGGGPVESFVADTQSHDVVVYTAEWCGFCKKTKAFLKQKGVSFRERDVERDPGAERELQAKAKRAGVRVSGVPVTDFMGELVMGFDQPRLERLIAARAAAPAPAP
ncbi:MAG: hypothetical protein HY904_04505 [Deltaproteobacteria bacterium]|nr:hypothetical protein [Deltaproteobacteria bacterium]